MFFCNSFTCAHKKMAWTNFLFTSTLSHRKVNFPYEKWLIGKNVHSLQKKINPHILLIILSYSHSYAGIYFVCTEDCPDYCESQAFWFWDKLLVKIIVFYHVVVSTTWMDGLNFKKQVMFSILLGMNPISWRKDQQWNYLVPCHSHVGFSYNNNLRYLLRKK